METIIRPQKHQCPMCGKKILEYEFCYKTDNGKYLYQASCSECKTDLSLTVIKELHDIFETERIYHQHNCGSE